jgi:hypothetical protein
MTPADWHAVRRFLYRERLDLGTPGDDYARGYLAAVEAVGVKMRQQLEMKRQPKKEAGGVRGWASRRKEAECRQ